MLEQLVALGCAKIDIRIEEQRGEIVMRKSRTHSLKIDQVSLTVPDQNVLRLKIAMDQDARQTRQLLGDFVKRRTRAYLLDLRQLNFEITAEAIFEKVILFPKIKRGIEFGR